MKILGLITARGGSKGIPGKNIKILAGKPLIVWTIEAALQSSVVDRVIVSTDDPEIAAVSKAHGADVPFLRPADLAQDDSPHILAVEHAIRWLQENESYHPDFKLLLQPTSPLRTTQDIDAAIALAKSRSVASVVSVCEAKHHPFFVKRVSEDLRMHDFIKTDAAYMRRQDLPPAFALNGAIYLSRIDFIAEHRSFISEDTLAYVMPTERSVDIDTPWDFFLTEAAFSRKQEALC